MAIICYTWGMSKKSHAKHEHQVRHDDIVPADSMNNDFSKRHKRLIIVLAIVMIIVLPLLFAAGTLLRMIHF